MCFPELALTGYPPEDLLLKEHFLADARAALRPPRRCRRPGIVAIVGFPERAEDVYNAAAVLADGAVQAIYRKVHLPNYGVFDELRYFQPGARGATIEVDGVKVGLTICEDIWQPGPPLSDEALAGARLIVNISASPYHAGKGAASASGCSPSARATTSPRSRSAPWSAARTSSSSTAHSVVVDHDGTRDRARAAVRPRRCSSPTSTRSPPARRACATRAAAPAGARPRGSVDAPRVVHRPRRGASDAAARRAAVAPLLDEVDEVYARARARHARLRRARTASSTSCSGFAAGSTRRSSR